MKSRLAISVTLSGYIILGAYVVIEAIEYKAQVLIHFFFPTDSYILLFHIFILLTPFISTTLGYLVNERTKLLKSFIVSEEKYRDLYQNAPDGYHSIDTNGIFLDVNDTWLKMLGYERDEVVGKMKIIEILADDALKAFEKFFPVLKEKGYVENLEYDFRRKDGSLLPVLINVTAVYDKDGRFLRSRTVIRDNTAKKVYETQLMRAAEEWRATFDFMPLGALLIDRDFNIIRANKYIADITGIPLKEVVGKKCYEVIHGEPQHIKDCPLPAACDSYQTETLEYYEEKIGKHFIIQITPILDEEKRIIAFVHSLIDITDIKNKEEQMGKSRDAFFNMLKDLNFAHTQLKTLYTNLILAFANALDAKSPWTKGHSERVAGTSIAIAKEMGLKEEEIDLLRTAALLHDIGKIGTYDVILNKADKLTAEEFALVKEHPAKGEEILKPIKELVNIYPIIRSHHERVDGKGYPDRLKGEGIPLLSRIICVADSFDSMTADRPYRPASGREYAITELRRCSGTQFDPAVVEAFLRVLTQKRNS
ncbi:MAG: PAS domain S-box protein [Nitrospirae bacterium]|nr:PAS domain S-box protein [Nitrospirota bacterium]